MSEGSRKREPSLFEGLDRDCSLRFYIAGKAGDPPRERKHSSAPPTEGQS